MVTMTSKGDWGNISKFLEKASKSKHLSALDAFGMKGVEALQAATPVDTGRTAALWRYEIAESANGVTISFHNDNINKGVNIALIVNYGHGTGTGGWVEGRHYIEPAIRPIFDEMVDALWKEVNG